MKKVNSIATIIRMTIVCFLFFSFVSTSLNLTTNGKVLVGLFSLKKVKGPTHRGADCPMEEAGKEVENRGEDKGNHNTLVLYALQDFSITLLFDSGTVQTVASHLSYGTASCVPLYLANRTLLI